MKEITILSFADANDEAAYKVKNGSETLWFCIQKYSEGGYDYNLYHEDYSEMAGGIIDDEELTMSEAALEALKECGVDVTDIHKKLDFADYEAITDAAYKKWEERIKKLA